MGSFGTIDVGIQFCSVSDDELNVMIDSDVRGKRSGRKVVPSSADVTCFVDGRLARLEPLCSRSSS